MSMQLTFGGAQYNLKPTRREVFLAEIEQVVSWKALLSLIEPRYPKSGQPGRQPHLLENDAVHPFDDCCTRLGQELGWRSCPDMHQTKKGNQYDFGVKALIRSSANHAEDIKNRRSERPKTPPV